MQNKNNKNGYTIIETMIAVSLFLIVVMAGMGSLLNANLLHNKSRDMRSIIDNLSFVMEDMSRNLRMGYNYRCYKSGVWDQSYAQTENLNTPQSCASGGTIVFEEAHGTTPFTVPISDKNATDQWIYKIESSGGLTCNIFKSTKGGGTSLVPDWMPLNPNEVALTCASSYFSVSGAERGGPQQPFVTIRLIGKITYKGVETPFSLQTSVSQRALDI